MAKKRANGEGTIRKRKNGTWEARVTIGFDSKTGKQKYKCIYGKTQTNVKNKLKELMSDKEEIANNALGMTTGEWLDTWLEDYLSDVKDGTAVQYESVCRLHIKPIIGKIPLATLSAPAIQKLYNNLQKKGAKSKVY